MGEHSHTSNDEHHPRLGTKSVASYQFTTDPDPDVHEQLANAKKQIKNLKKALKSSKKQLQQRDTSSEQRDKQYDTLRSDLASQNALIRTLQEQTQRLKRQLQVSKTTIRDYERRLNLQGILVKRTSKRRRPEMPEPSM